MEKGTFGTMLTGDIYVIGANQITGLNYLSLILFACALLGVFGHALIRIIKK